MSHKRNRNGLILLVVLGMLALLSLLAVTYVVFASQTRATSVAHTRTNVRKAPVSPLLDEAVKQLIRGTTNPMSSMQSHDLLADLYGIAETNRLAGGVGTFRIRTAPAAAEVPMLLGGEVSGGNYVPGYFLRIPLEAPPNSQLPSDDDALNGRIVTFPPGNGPLSGYSFHILRYIGNGSTASDLASSRFSITIDLREADLAQVHSQMVGPNASISATRTLLDWALTAPQGAYLCYRDGTNYGNGYQLLINGVALNGHGVGIGADVSSQMYRLPDQTSVSSLNYVLDERIRDFPVGLQPRPHDPGQAGNLIDEFGQSNAQIVGDSDEPFDAADYNTPFLAYRDASGRVIPSFHRSALINYIVNFKPSTQWTEEEFWAVLRRIELAVMRPLPIDITSANPIPAFMGVTGNLYVTHPQFTAGAIPTLTMRIPATWDPNILTSDIPNISNFQGWVAALTNGPWDVDNDNDGSLDGIWKDIGLPFQRTPDGRLLKALVSYYVEDLDGKIDVNATGGTAQAGLYATLSGVTAPAGDFSIGNVDPSVSSQPPSGMLQQGLGYGPADIGFAHLMGKDPSGSSDDIATVANPLLGYANLMRLRYQHPGNPGSWRPGADGWDAPGQLLAIPGGPQVYDQAGRQFFSVHRHDRLPGLPLGSRGRVSLVLDRLGNPFSHNLNTVVTGAESEYEARLIEGSHQDSIFQLAEWERVYRSGDGDRALLPIRLEQAFGENPQTIASSSLKSEITVRSRHLLAPRLSARSRQSQGFGAESFFQLINSVRNLKDPSLTPLSVDQYRALFPMEFVRGNAFNINRPFGNGIDSNQDGEIDEPTELTNIAQRAPQATSKVSILPQNHVPGLVNGPLQDSLQANTDFDPVGIPDPVFGGLESRQLFARHLYCLAQLLVPQDYAFPNVDRAYWLELIRLTRSGGTPPQERAAARRRLAEIRAQILAQWSVNVVDYRDSDAVMTRFPYDLDPLGTLGGAAGVGWFPNRAANGNLTSGPDLQVNVAWGMEQPELLMSESLAFHDIRVRKDTVDPQRFFDQFRKPEGSLFLELYAPRTTGAVDSNLPGVPSSLYTTVGNEVALELDKLTPAISGFEQFPVWRIYIGNPVNKAADPQSRRYKTADERLRAPPAQNVGNVTVTRFDLTHQLSISNVRGDATFWRDATRIEDQAELVTRQAGLLLDRTTDVDQRLVEFDPLPDRMDLFDPRESRVVLFARNFTPTFTNTPGVADPDSQVFTNRTSTNANPLRLFGNQYLVVGPRPVTYLGSRVSSKTNLANEPNQHRIQLNGNWANMYQSDGSQYRNVGQNVRDCVTIEAAARVPSVWTGTTNPPTLTRIGLNVSEPLTNDTDYYDRPDAQANSSNTNSDSQTGALGFGDTAMPADAYHDFVAPAGPVEPPFDDGRRGPLQNWVDRNSGELRLVSEIPGDPNSPRVVQPGTEPDWCSAYLQRLADPEKPWHEIHNPYLTVDWIPIDLTVFSGEENHPDLNQPLSLASRQKTGQFVDPSSLAFPPAARGQTFLSSITHPIRASTEDTALPSFLKYQIVGDRGAGNSSRPSDSDGSGAFATLGFLNSTFVLGAESGIASLPPYTIAGFSGFVGSPADPLRSDNTWFPSSVFWANRPFVNSYELAYVPLSSPGQLGQEFSAVGDNIQRYLPAYTNPDPQMPTSPHSDAGTTGAANPAARTVSSHLLNFFQEMPELRTAVNGNRHLKDYSLAQLFELTETPSPWADVSLVEPPTLMDPKPAGSNPILIANNAILRPFRAPYNTISRRVEPGRINLNTISNQNVFQALFSNVLSPAMRLAPNSVAPFWNDFERSRRGYDPQSGNLNSHFPTEFAGLFKPVSEAGMVPRTRDRDPATNSPLHPLVTPSGVLDLYARRNPVHSTIMRAGVQGAGATGILDLSNLPAFRQSPVPNQNHPHVLTDLNFISRLDKLVTDRSNVFAVYITVGLFEVTDSLGIGREYGIDNGQNKRFRAFYVIDRSIPVGYRVGEDLNTEKTILVRRLLSE